MLQAVINETLRLYPTIIAILPRTAVEDTIVDGVVVPKGVSILLSMDLAPELVFVLITT